jgi:hypothetical protein
LETPLRVMEAIGVPFRIEAQPTVLPANIPEMKLRWEIR